MLSNYKQSLYLNNSIITVYYGLTRGTLAAICARCPTLNGANTAQSPVAWGFSGIVARFCLSFCGTVFVIGDGGPAASIQAAVAPVVVPVCFFIGIRGTAAKGCPGLLRGSEEGSTRKKTVASGSGFPGIVRRGSDLCNTWKGNGPVWGAF